MANSLITDGFASDQDLYDLLMHHKKKMSSPSMRHLAAERGTFYSVLEPRQSIADHLSYSSRDFQAVAEIVKNTEQTIRAEKTTSYVIDEEIPSHELKEFAAEYKAQMGLSETLNDRKIGQDKFRMDLQYTEQDHSRTKLLQRKIKDARIEITKADGKTIIRMPANDKTHAFVSKLESKLKTTRTEPLKVENFELGAISIANRSKFFIDLMNKFPKHGLHDVTFIKVAKVEGKDQNKELSLNTEDEEDDQANAIVSSIRKVSLTGNQLHFDSLYKDVMDKDFFITETTFISNDTKHPYSRVKINIGFENTSDMSGFKYRITQAKRSTNNTYPKNFDRLTNELAIKYCSLLETTAASIKASLLTGSDK